MFTRSIDIFRSTGQLLSKSNAKFPAENDALVKLPKLPALYVPTFDSLNAGNGPTKLDTEIFEVPIPSTKSSLIAMFTEPVDPGLLTDVILSPSAFVIVFPASDPFCVALPPFAATFVKL